MRKCSSQKKIGRKMKISGKSLKQKIRKLNDVGRSRKTLNYFHFTQSLSKSISSFYLHVFFVTVDNQDALLP